MIELFTRTASDVATEVKTQFGDTGNVQITDAYIIRWINNGQRQIASADSFIEKVFTTSLIAGQSTYNLGTLMAGLRPQSYASIVADGRKVDVVPWARYQDIIGNATATTEQGSPTIYGTMYGDTLTLWPVPPAPVVSGLVIYYHAWPADIAAVTDTLTIPDRYYNALVAYCLSKALELDENFQAAGQQNELHNAAVAIELGRSSLSPTAAYPVVPFDDDGWVF